MFRLDELGTQSGAPGAALGRGKAVQEQLQMGSVGPRAGLGIWYGVLVAQNMSLNLHKNLHLMSESLPKVC